MSPQLPLLVAALAGCLLPARGCVTCDAKVVEALYHFEMEYLPSRDSPTLKKLSMDFLKNLKRITNSEEQGFCPNKCGQMLQTLIWCHNCLKRIHTCRKPIDCGVHEVVVHELEDLVLDCELSWHRISAGVNNYTFYRVLGSNSLLLSVGKEPTLTKTMVRLEDAGTYRCELANMKTSRAGVTHFHVRVLPQRAGGAVWSSPTTTTTATTEYEFSTDWDLSLLFPTALANPSECPKSEDILRGRLIGLLLWGLLVLLIAFVTAILCFRPGKVINYIKAWRTNQKEAAQQAQTAMEPQAALESQGGREPQGAQKPQSARKPQAAPKPSVSKGKLSASKLQ
ncbi:izumo sperm-egg fusion protein 1 isoform X6 [Vulpes lagopus]|uniref:izumo sperm-egg fusion protein 1 isoform X6 n=1 Tax=Vulpes lagopus TaxID=494514 RepID=UPI001BC9FB49|nr:izumo sperm-egg fusion protein 1 isoform X6 [Vulpes lagopus]